MKNVLTVAFIAISTLIVNAQAGAKYATGGNVYNNRWFYC